MRKKLRLSLSALAALLLATPALAVPTNHLINGSFETGDFTGWTQGGDISFTSVTPFGYGPEDGTYSVFAGPVTPGTLNQTFSATAGSSFTLSFWAISTGIGSSGFSLIFNGVTLLTVDPVPGMPWTEFTATATALATNTFTLSQYNVDTYNGFDNFHADGEDTAGNPGDGTGGTPTSTPEPGSLVLFGTAAFFFIPNVRRRRRS